MKQKLISELLNYQCFNEQEDADLPVLLKALHDEAVFSRDNLLYHFSASSWIVNHDYTKVLMCFHNIYQSWSWTGGHADGNMNLFDVALSEAKEETGLSSVHAVNPEIYSIEILTVKPHIKRGKFVNAHLHLNVTYLFQADETEELTVKEDENSALAWMSLDEAVNRCTEAEMKPIYAKLNEKLKMLSQND